MIITQTKPLTLEQFLDLPETKPASEYVAAGKIIQKPMPQGKHSLLQLELVFFINSILRKAGIAIAFPELRCTIGGRSIVPDVVVLEQQNIPKDEDGEIANKVPIAPDWLVEILSPDQSTTKVILNILHCLNCGTQVAWLIDPAEKIIFVYQPEQQIQFIDDLAQEVIVPEFASTIKLTAGEIFSWLKPG